MNTAVLTSDTPVADSASPAAHAAALILRQPFPPSKPGKELPSRAVIEQRIPLGPWALGPAVEPSHCCLHEAFEAWAARQPEAIAVEHLGRSITYRELNARANRLARHLRHLGVRPGGRVGLYVQRSLEMVIGMIAVLKLGAAYVPQCVGIAPAPQMADVAEQAGVSAVLTLSGLRAELPPLTVPVVDIDEALSPTLVDPGESEAFVSDRPVRPEDLCFVLFTSGTTGRPNGVMVTHRNVANIVLTRPGDLGLQPGMRVAQLLNIAFDMAAWEVLGALSHGATLVIRGSDFQAVAETVDAIIATPSVLARIDPARCARIKVVAVAGEPCPQALADAWAARCRFYNACGPTEVTIVNTMHEHQAGTPLNIGKPTPNNTVYVLDDQMRPCAPGEVGEMWAGGVCVSRGYIGNETLTRERYRPDPFLGGGNMMFRTRDRGRWTSNGELEHLGRVDDQVKVRGFRVELDSVSALLERTPGCAQAVTLKFDDRTLVSFVRPSRPRSSIDCEAAQDNVRAVLPYYCVPAKVFVVDRFPMTDRGKIDKRNLRLQAEAAMGGHASEFAS